MSDAEGAMRRLQAGEVQYDRLKAGDSERMTDAYLRKRLAETYPWIDGVYTQTSDFVHLSFRHLWTSIGALDDETHTVTFAVSGTDARAKDETAYYEVCDAFLQTSIMTSTVIAGMFMLLHLSAEVEEAYRKEQESDGEK